MRFKARVSTLLGCGLAAFSWGMTEAQITIRTQEPIVIRASSIPALAGKPIDRIRLYRRTATTWEPIPFQIDEFETVHLNPLLSTGCTTPWDPCERAAKLSGEVGDGFNGTDELVFMARDAGIGAYTNDWVGVPGVETEATRVGISLQDGQSPQSGAIYAYVWITNPPADSLSSVRYVDWTEDSSNPKCVWQMGLEPQLDPACGWLRSTDQGSIGSLPRFNVMQAGNWTVSALCVKPYATDATCAADNNSTNVLDQAKWRTTIPIESERGWDHGCRVFIEPKVGPVRVVRRIQGAQSGRHTTKIDYFYGTWWEQVTNIRVHDIGSVRFVLDNRALNVQNPDETPAFVFTKKQSELTSGQPMDTMDLAAPAATVGDFLDWVQVDTSRGTYVQFYEERRAIPDATTTFVYEDSSETSNLEYQAGRFGQHGMRWAGDPCLPNMQDFVCNEEDPENGLNLIYAAVVRTLVPLAVDSGPPFVSDEGSAYAVYKGDPVFAAPEPQTYGPPGPPPPQPCTPLLTGSGDGGGFSNSLTVNTNHCTSAEASGVRLYRGTVTGLYTFLADLGKSATFRDARVKVGPTYRYIARAYNAAGQLGAQSAEVALTVTDTVPPPVPSGVSATPGGGKVTLSWTAPMDRDTKSVIVHVSTAPGGPYTPLNLADPITCSGSLFVVSGLASGESYYFTLTSKDFHGNESAYSQEVNATPTP